LIFSDQRRAARFTLLQMAWGKKPYAALSSLIGADLPSEHEGGHPAQYTLGSGTRKSRHWVDSEAQQKDFHARAVREGGFLRATRQSRTSARDTVCGEPGGQA
jgi:hypothetical protein